MTIVHPCPEPWRSILLLVPRAALGAGIAVGFGLPKLRHFEAYADEVARSGAPWPTAIAVLLLAVELVGGAFLALGLATRAAGASLALAMLGVLAVPRYAALPWDAVTFLLGGYLFAIIGGGRWSVDHALAGRLGGRLAGPEPQERGS